MRYKQIENEIRERQEAFSEFCAGVQRFIYGLGKKMLLANFLAQIADNAFDYFYSPSVMSAWLGAIAYTLQIYFDFSGYSDMAIGLGRMFGFHFSENFQYPYIARSVTEFWRRWHISLSSWFRDYVYIPMGGNRVGKSRWMFNMFVVWLLTGIWHGANWTFVLWGLLYFVVLVLEKQFGIAKKIGRAGNIYTMLVVILAWVFFRAADVSSACRYIGCMFGVGSGGFLDNQFISAIKGTYVVLLVSLLGATPFLMKTFDALKKRGFAWLEGVWLIVIFSLSVLEIISSAYNPFIYFNF